MTTARVSSAALLLAMSLLAPGAVGIALACSCMENPPCAAAGWADAVVVGTVVQKEREVIRGGLGWMVHRIAVAQSLRGAIGPSLTLVPDVTVTEPELARASTQTGETEVMSTCGYPFELGEQYVIYLRRRADGRWTTSMCAGTKPVSEAAVDLDYFADLATATPDARVYGSVTIAVPDASDPVGVGTTPAPRVRVAVTGRNTRRTVISDVRGAFDVRLPPGEYSVAPVVPYALKVYNAPARVLVPAYACAPVRFTLDPDRLLER